ncbi:hypothetical protein STCU_11501 [Strigomonas culicis]|uniref:Uncharacterized protein n=1 Tax=Strigomonas culicis TaxID=28005 RepID=S9UND9_9TRYP|nr:hypothetical protein STCU_11501 [Strigomonas culicis]|eukprot:EPY16176.1 hypothetical protein STCU_11501 [Strigomonas culicis]
MDDVSSNYSLSPREATATSATSRLIPSSRHMTLQSVWRLLLFNVSRTCELVRTCTPKACPFTRMMAAISVSLDNLDSKPAARHQRSTQKEMIRVAAKALRTCAPAEVDLVCLVVAIVSYVRNMDNMRRRVSSVELQRVTLQGFIQGTAQLVLGRTVEYEQESRLMEILAGDGKELMENAQLRYFEGCTWHPYSKLLYNARSS